MKFGSSIDIFFSSAQLICRSTDISKCFRGSLRLRDNESDCILRPCLMSCPIRVASNEKGDGLRLSHEEVHLFPLEKNK